MKKIFAIIVSVLFFASLSIAVIGCKKAEEQKPAAPKVEAPAATPAPGAAAAPAAPGAPAPAAPAAPAAPKEIQH